MKPAAIVGILLVILVVIGLAYGGISHTNQTTVVDIGPIKATADERKTIPVPPVLGGIALVGGIVLLVTGGKK